MLSVHPGGVANDVQMTELVQFLVRIEIDTGGLDASAVAHLRSAEARRAAELADQGSLLALWRVDGRWANVGIWQAANEDALNSILDSLPLRPYMQLEVVRLAEHPSNPRPSRSMAHTQFADVLHVGFTVQDIERSVNWYGRVLGLELIHSQHSDNAYIRTLVGVDDAVLEVAQFALPGNPPRYSTHILELIQYAEGAGAPAGRQGVNQAGTAHLGFVVTDINAMYEQLAADGVEFINPPVLVTEGANVGGYACYLRDPDGIVLELMQFAPERAARLGIAHPAVP